MSVHAQISYQLGQYQALTKLGFALPTVGGAALGGLGGYLLSDDENEARNAAIGAALGAGTGFGLNALLKARMADDVLPIREPSLLPPPPEPPPPSPYAKPKPPNTPRTREQRAATKEGRPPDADAALSVFGERPTVGKAPLTEPPETIRPNIKPLVPQVKKHNVDVTGQPPPPKKKK